jgi:hypothetical protein
MLHKTKRLIDAARRHLSKFAIVLDILSELLGSLTKPTPKPLKAVKPKHLRSK